MPPFAPVIPKPLDINLISGPATPNSHPVSRECVWCPFVLQGVGCPGSRLRFPSPHLEHSRKQLGTKGRNKARLAPCETALNHALLLTTEGLGKQSLWPNHSFLGIWGKSIDPPTLSPGEQ